MDFITLRLYSMDERRKYIFQCYQNRKYDDGNQVDYPPG